MTLVEIDHGAEDFPFQQLAQQIRDRIASGEYRTGRAIPSYERLHQETGVAITTVRRAVALLAAEGLVRIRPGRGVFVVDSAAPRQKD